MYSVCRMVNLARDYSLKRVCFGKTIKDHKLHVKTLANMEVHFTGLLLERAANLLRN